MKSQQLLYFTLAGFLSAIALPTLAQSSGTVPSGFRCDTSGDLPTTMYHNSQGVGEPWIKWQSNHFANSGWNPEARCQEVSSRLETYRRDRKLKYVTLGTVNNQSVICVASQQGGQCEGIIYTLKPGQDGLKALNNLFAWRQGSEQGLQSNYESATTIPYIDVGSKLEETSTLPPIVQPAPESTPVNTLTTPREL